MKSARAVTASGVVWSLVVWRVSDASGFAEKMDGKPLPMLIEFTDEHNRQRLSQVSRPLRQAVQRAREQLTAPEKRVWVPCQPSRIHDCLNTVGEWDERVTVFSRDSRIDVNGVPKSRVSKYDGRYTVVHQAPGQHHGRWKQGWNQEWVILNNDKGKLQSAKHLKSGSEVSLAEYEKVIFAHSKLAVAHSVSDEGVHSLHLISVMRGEPSAKSLRCISLGTSPSGDLSLPLSFGVTVTENESNKSTEIRATLRVFAKIEGSDQFAVKLRTFDLFTGKLNQEILLKVPNGLPGEISESAARNGLFHLPGEIPRSMIYQSYFDATNQESKMFSTSVESGQWTKMMSVIGKVRSSVVNANDDYAVIETEYGPDLQHHGLVLYNLDQKCMIAGPLPFHQRPQFVRWLSNEIFAVKQQVYGEKDPSYFGVSVDQPHHPFPLPEGLAQSCISIPNSQSMSIMKHSGTFQIIEWDQRFPQPRVTPVIPAQVQPSTMLSANSVIGPVTKKRKTNDDPNQGHPPQTGLNVPPIPLPGPPPLPPGLATAQRTAPPHPPVP